MTVAMVQTARGADASGEYAAGKLEATGNLVVLGLLLRRNSQPSGCKCNVHLE